MTVTWPRTSLVGKWWEPSSPEIQFSGKLNTEGLGSPTLVIVDPPLEWGRKHPVPILFGADADHGLVTATDAHTVGTKWSFGVRSSTLRVSTALIGAHVGESDDRSWRRVEMAIPTLGWMLPSTGNLIGWPSLRAKSARVSLERHARSWESLTTGVVVTIESQLSVSSNDGSTAVSSAPVLRLTHRDPRTIQYWIEDWLRPINDLIEVIVGTKSIPTSVSVWERRNPSKIERSSRAVKVNIAGVGDSIAPDRTLPMLTVAEISDDPETFARIVSRIEGVKEDYFIFFGLLIDAVRDDGTRPLHNRFLDVIAALEAFDTKRFGVGPIPQDDFRQAATRALVAVRNSDLADEHKKFVRKALRTRSEYSLHERLRRTAKSIGVDTKRWGHSPEQIGALRNTIAHGNDIPPGADFAGAFEQMLAFARHLALAEVGLVRAVAP